MVIKARQVGRAKEHRLLNAFDSDIKFCGLSDGTRRQYLFIAKRYLEFTGGNPTWSRSEIMEFIASLGDVTSTYAFWVLSIVRRFHRSVLELILQHQTKWPIGPREGPRPKVRPQPSFGEDVIDKLLRSIKDERDYAVTRILFATGMRRDELCRLDIDDYKGKKVFITMAKGEESRTVRLDRVTCKAIDTYLDTRDDKNDALFVNDHRQRYTPSALSQVFRRYFRNMGAEPRTGLHAFRRGLVTVLHDRGLTREEIQKWFGWKTPTMVERYIQLSPSVVSGRVEKVHPFYDKEGKKGENKT